LWLASTYYFLIYFPKKGAENKLVSLIVLVSVVFLSLITIFTDLLVKSAEVGQESSSPILGDYWYYIYLVIFFLFCIMFKIIFRKYFGLSAKEKAKVSYFVFGLLIFITMNFVFNVFLSPRLGMIPYAYIGNDSAIFFLMLTAYAITKHELMGIKTLVTQTLIVVITIILLLDVLVLSEGIVVRLLKIGILIAFLYFSYELVKSIKKEKESKAKLEESYAKINQYVRELEKANVDLEERNKDLKALLEISDVTSETLDSRKIAQSIVDSIPVNLSHLGYKGGVLVLYNRKKRVVHTYAITESKIAQEAKKLLDKPFLEHSECIDDADNFVIQTIKTGKIYVGGRLEEFIAPTVSKNVCRLIQKLVGAKSFVSIPLFSRGKVMGAIVFVGTRPEKTITQRDKDILYMFSSHIGSAIENSQLYEKTNRQMKELSRLNKNLTEANQKLKELLKMKNEFLHITSHQLRTPLTAIRGMISMWYEGDFDNLSPRERRKMLKRICISAERLNNITNDMLDALELEGGFMKFQFKKVSLKKIVEETIDTLKPNFVSKNLYIKFTAKNKSLPKIEVEPNYIRQVFLNLIDNACKYTRKGGVEVNIRKTKKCLEVSIKDTGIGMSKKDQKKVFQKFTRGKNAAKENASGSGLGMFIAKKIVDAHHGKIEFHSDGIGKGSVVRVLLPIEQR